MKELIDKIDTVHELRYVESIGKRTPLTQGALKKAMLAYLPEDEISRVLDQIEQILGARGKKVNKESIMAELSQIRKNGYALSFGEVNPGTVAIGSPAFDYKGRVTASIGIMGPKNRFSPDEMPVKIKIVKKAAIALTRNIGGRVSFEEP